MIEAQKRTLENSDDSVAPRGVMSKMGMKRSLADAAEHVLGARIVNPVRIASLFEEQHLKRFFAHFGIDCVFDVGANVGQYVTMLRDRVGFRGPIISFEPNPAAAAKLNAMSKNDPRWHVAQLALDAVAGERQFNVMADDQFSSLLRPDQSSTAIFSQSNKVERTLTVSASTIYLEMPKLRQEFQFERPFLKMDTQGHDLAVAKGAGDRIGEFVGLQSEMGIKTIYQNAPNYRETLDFYESKGFLLSAFVPNNEGHFPDLLEIDCVMYNKAFAG
jgi:FkbM family methyltransferase